MSPYDSRLPSPLLNDVRWLFPTLPLPRGMRSQTLLLSIKERSFLLLPSLLKFPVGFMSLNILLSPCFKRKQEKFGQERGKAGCDSRIICQAPGGTGKKRNQFHETWKLQEEGWWELQVPECLLGSSAQASWEDLSFKNLLRIKMCCFCTTCPLYNIIHIPLNVSHLQTKYTR